MGTAVVTRTTCRARRAITPGRGSSGSGPVRSGWAVGGSVAVIEAHRWSRVCNGGGCHAVAPPTGDDWDGCEGNVLPPGSTGIPGTPQQTPDQRRDVAATGNGQAGR